MFGEKLQFIALPLNQLIQREKAISYRKLFVGAYDSYDTTNQQMGSG